MKSGSSDFIGTTTDGSQIKTNNSQINIRALSVKIRESLVDFTGGKNMSRIGKQSIKIPQGIKVSLEGDKIKVSGPKGELEQKIHPQIKVEIKNDEIKLTTDSKDKKIKAIWGLLRKIIANMVLGVSEGFEKILEIHGIGFRAKLEGEKLILKLGFSHPTEIKPPPGISFTVEKNNIKISGADKELVGRIAAKIRSLRKPEPYKGKGIKYVEETIKRKAGKAAKTAGATGVGA